MTPEALARLTQQSNRALVDTISRLAGRLGAAAPELDALRAIKPSTRQPAATMLRERQALVSVVEAIDAAVAALLEAPPAEPAHETPPSRPASRKGKD